MVHGALEGLESVGTLLLSHLGEVKQPDIVPELADLLLRMKGKTWCLVTGRFKDRVYLSIRTTNPRAQAGHVMGRLVGRNGKGGGHGMMAGGWVKITVGYTADPRSLQDQLGRRLAKILKKNPDKISPLDLGATARS
jgi:nanoRNase/pAp phosphatase (c-di-AMP/oligoRNAs hydrolase)